MSSIKGYTPQRDSMASKSISRKAPPPPTAGASSASAAAQKVRAKFDYNYTGPPKSTAFFSFKRGEVFTVVTKMTEDWLKVTRASGEVGCVPTNYMEPTNADGPRCRALYDYAATEAGQISLMRDAWYFVHSHGTDGWSTVRNEAGKIGIVPTSYLEDEVSVALANEPFFHGRIPLADAEKMLFLAKEGAYLVRESETDLGSYFLCMRSRKAAHEVHISRDGASGFFLSGDSAVRATIQELLKYYEAFEVKAGWGKLDRPLSPSEAHALMEREKERNYTEADLDRVLSEINEGMERLHRAAAASDGMFSAEQRAELAVLVEKRAKIMELRKAKGMPLEPAAGHVSPSSVRRKTPTHKPSAAAGKMSAAETVASFSILSPTSAAASAGRASSTSPVTSPSVVRRAAPPPPPAITAAEVKVEEKRAGPVRSAPPPPGQQGASISAPAPAAPTTAPATTTATRGPAPPPPGGAAAKTTTPSPTPASAPSAVSDAAEAPAARKASNPFGGPADAHASSNPFADAPVPVQQPAPATSVMPPQHSNPFASSATHHEPHEPLEPRSPLLSRTQQLSIIDIEEELKKVKGELIQAVRDQSGATFDQSKTAVRTVLGYILASIAHDPAATRAVLSVVSSSSSTDEDLQGGEDGKRLRTIIQELTDMKNDAQQRSWSVYDDSPIISEYLDEFVTLVQQGDPAVIAHIVRTYTSVGQVGTHEIVETLVVYYQMETRLELRLLLLRLFGALGTLDRDVFSVLQATVLPVELARDIMVDPHSDGNQQKTSYSLLLLAMIFSCGDAVSVQHYQYLNRAFIDFLLDLVEFNPQNDMDEQISDLAVNVVLAFNLHFPGLYDEKEGDFKNFIMEAFKGRNCKVFTEKLMLLVNRGNDPVFVETLGTRSTKKVQNSFIKILKDIFDREEIGRDFFYTNDLRVLVEVILRELSDRSHGDPARVDYLEVLMRLLDTSSYQDSPHKRSELMACLRALKDEENPDNDASTNTTKRMAADTLSSYFN